MVFRFSKSAIFVLDVLGFSVFRALPARLRTGFGTLFSHWYLLCIWWLSVKMG